MNSNTTKPLNCGPRLGGDLISTDIAHQLIAEIKGGAYRDVSQLPPEVELAAKLGVSRTVVRDALSEMERSGFIERVRGVGTIINHDVAAVERRMDLKFEFYKMIENLGHEAHSDHVMATKQEADTQIAEALQIPAGEPVLRVCKRVLADNTPVIFSTDIIPYNWFGSNRMDTIDFTRPIFDILAEYCGIDTSSTVTHIKASYGDPAVRRMLALSSDQALLTLDELCYCRQCRPVMLCRTHYTDFFDFAIVRKLV